MEQPRADLTPKWPAQWPVIPPLENELAARVGARLNAQARPPGSLGRLEVLACKLAAIQARDEPRVERIGAFIFAGDHGLTASNVSAYPSSVTAAMVATFLKGRATVNAFARTCDVELSVVDAGVDAEFAAHPLLIDAKIRRGTRDASVEAALTGLEAAAALQRGIELAAAAICTGMDAVILGEMGIGNTASSALLMHRLAPAPLDLCIGVGAGHDAAGLERKRETIAKAAARSPASDPFEVLCQFGGLEIAMMAGAAIGAAASRGIVVIDGFISSAAALVASRLVPEVLGYCVFAHASAERGHLSMLTALNARPLINLDMRLGEGSGAVLIAPILRSACRLANEVASLDDVMAGRH